ncbi:MAG: ABC transporter permease, partial [Burkholderiales bacterium]
MNTTAAVAGIAHPLLLRAMIFGAWRDNPARTVLATVAIALGVALGVAVHLINASALNEFNLAAHHLAGEADLVVRGPRAGFDENLYPRIASRPQVEAANPALEIEVALVGRRDTLKIVGLDPLRAIQVQPALLPEERSLVSDLFQADAILLSPSAAGWLGLRAGNTLNVQVGTRAVALQVIGLLPERAYPQRIGVMDIAGAQWKLNRLGRLNRMDLVLRPGTDIERFRDELQRELPAGVQVATPDAEAERGASISRAYRTNLDMLALIALFTGAFLVFSSQVLALLRRRTQFALLRALGITRPGLAVLLVGEGAAIGVIGAACGVMLGCVVAYYTVAHFGGDLGAGYFRAVTGNLHLAPEALAVYFALGVLFAVLGAAAPAMEAAQRPPAQALRAGDEEESLKSVRTTTIGVILIALGLALTWVPAVNGLPLAGYCAIALILLGAVLVMPRVAEAVLQLLPYPRFAPGALAVAQLQATPRQVAMCVAVIVISFSLMVSMLIMVHSFRASLETWLERMLPADLFLRSAPFGETAFLTTEEQARIAATPGIKRVEFLRGQNLLLSPERPPLILIARPLPIEAAVKTLPLVSPVVVSRSGPPPVWVSEVASDLYGWRMGDRIQLPIGNTPVLFTVAGIWRDYARQTGAIIVDRDLYIQLTGDRLANDAALWLASNMPLQKAATALRERLADAPGIEISSTREVRASSLSIFDRTFAVTYALEVAAILIGLFGVSVSFSAQALARRREFGVLRHVGMSRRDIGIMLGYEGVIVSFLGVGFGLACGWVVSLILIHVINRQSFHWSMDLHVPWLPLAVLGIVLIAAAAITAVWSGRAAMKEDVIRAVREDW